MYIISPFILHQRRWFSRNILLSYLSISWAEGLLKAYLSISIVAVVHNNAGFYLTSPRLPRSLGNKSEINTLTENYGLN